GARDGEHGLAPVLEQLRETGLRLQAGGGIRDGETVDTLFSMGVERVVLGSLAVREPRLVADWIAHYGAEHIVVALDVRLRDGQWRVATDGWTRDAEVTLGALAGDYVKAGLRHLLCTDIDRDGMLAGPNFDLYDGLIPRFPELSVQVSGGVREAGDIRRAPGMGAGGIEGGRALLGGRFTMKEALAC